MKIKVSEATIIQLDWLVAKIEQVLFPRSIPKYSSDWSQGGPIIEQEKISTIDVDGYDFWKAEKLNQSAESITQYGPTPLIAAMRCYVASCLGEEVEVPEELPSRSIEIPDEIDGASLPEFDNFYRCPGCGHEWVDIWTAQCDEDCPACSMRNISPYKSEDVE